VPCVSDDHQVLRHSLAVCNASHYFIGTATPTHAHAHTLE
jgi:hypothetical protein